MVDALDGKMSQIGFWKLKKQLFLKVKEPPTAKYDEAGNIVTGVSSLKYLYLSTY